MRNQDLELLRANKQVVRSVFETVWNEGDFEDLDSLLAPEVRFHFRGTATVRPEDLQALVELWRKAFPDLEFTIGDLIAEGDLVAIRLRFTGTHTGTDWWGLAASGKAIDVSEMMFFRLQDGRIVEAWEEYDDYTMRKQLGALD